MNNAHNPSERPNRETVENIGQRIGQLRESRLMTQSQLHARSRISRSYLSRIENGKMTPGLGTLEKISEALGVGLNRFLVPASNGEAWIEDPFIQELRPFLRQLDLEQWQSILKWLRAMNASTSEQHTPPSLASLREMAFPVSQRLREAYPILRDFAEEPIVTEAEDGRVCLSGEAKISDKEQPCYKQRKVGSLARNATLHMSRKLS